MSRLAAAGQLPTRQPEALVTRSALLRLPALDLIPKVLIDDPEARLVPYDPLAFWIQTRTP